MDPVRNALYDLLTGDTQLTDLLSAPDAIHHGRAPQGTDPPFVVFHLQDGRPRWTYDDYTRWDLWTVKAIDRGMSASTAEDIAARINTLLNDAQLTISDREHLHLRWQSTVSYSEEEAGELWRHEGGVYQLVTSSP